MARLLFKYTIVLLMMLAGTRGYGQQTLNWRADAVWVKMIDDPNVNYYEAIKIYNQYWLTHKKPVEKEDDMAELAKTKTEGTTSASPLTREEKIFEDEMTYQVKRFENWVREEKPFVQENGHILTPQERVAIWEQQQRENQK